MASEEMGVPVQLYIYDLTQGMARMFSPMLLGRQIEGVWHTAIVVYGREYFYGGGGITNCTPGSTQLGQPLKIENLGETFVPFNIFSDYIHGLATSTYSGVEYNLFDHNCNNFTNEVSEFLCGREIPKYILNLPNELSPQLRQSLQSLIDGLSNGGQSVITNGVRQSRQDSPEFQRLNTQIEESRLQSLALEERRSTLKEKLDRKERKRRKKKRKDKDCPHCSTMADSAVEEAQLNGSELTTAEPSDNRVVIQQDEVDEEERRQEEERKRNREPPVVFKNMDSSDAFDKLVEVLGTVTLSTEEQQSLDELHQYLVLNEGSWALGDNFLVFVGRLLNDESVSSDVRVRLIHSLAVCALKDDVVLLLHQDRRDHTLMNYSYRIDRLPLAEQCELALFICNLFENTSSSEWLLYISEWSSNNQQISNIRATTKVAVHTLLSEDDKLKDIGTAIVHNLACKEVKTVVFDDVTVEITMAILQLLSTKLSEEHLFRSLKALAKFCQLSGQDVPQLIQMIGPHPSTFSGTSERIDEQIAIISRKVK